MVMQNNFAGVLNVTTSSYPADILIEFVDNKTKSYNITNLDKLNITMKEDSLHDLTILKQSLPHIDELTEFPSGQRIHLMVKLLDVQGNLVEYDEDS